jgi:hypothetical protein
MITDSTMWRYIRRQLRVLLKYVGVPLIVITFLSLVLLYVIGGADLLRFVAARLFTWSGMAKVLFVVSGLAAVTWLRHVIWFADEPPPKWVRRPVWLNVFEGVVLLAIVAVGAWAILRFATPIPR